MALQTIAEFEALTSDSRKIIVCAEKLSDAALALESGTTVLDQVTITRRAVQVDVPAAKVRFNVTVDPPAAVTAGCVALPSTFLVDPGDKVILQAKVDKEALYEFLGWYRDTVLVSADAVSEIVIVAPTAPEVADNIVAKFELST